MQSLFLPGRLQRFLYEKGSYFAAPNSAERDANYEDAVLDLELRSYFRSEYGTAEPPPGVFSRLLATIRSGPPGLAREGDGRQRAPIDLRGLYSALRSSTAHRLASAGVAAAVMLAALSSGSLSFLRPHTGTFEPEAAAPSTTPIPVGEGAADVAAGLRDRPIAYPPSPSPDPEFYSAFERRMPQRIDGQSGSTTAARWQRSRR